MTIGERDMLHAAEYFLDILDKAKGNPFPTERGEWLDRARKIINTRKAQWIDNTTPRRYGPDDPNPTR